MRTYEYIVVHHAAAYDDERKRVVHQSVEVVRRYHVTAKPKGRGFADIAYQRYVEGDGKIRIGRLDATPGAHTEGFNARSLGVCVSGHADHEPFNAPQMASLVAQCVAWCRLYSLDANRVIGHREAPRFGAKPVGKTCPGTLTDMDAIRARVRAELVGVNRGVALESVVSCPPRAPSDDEPPSTRRK